ncbi:MAG: hypothetical protein ACKVH8_08520 [Pirellulales bacterium]
MLFPPLFFRSSSSALYSVFILIIITVATSLLCLELRAEDVVPAEVKVKSLRSRDIDLENDWKDAPTWLAGSHVFDQLEPGLKKKPAFSHIKAVKKGLVLIAATWNYSGSAKGDWGKIFLKPDQLIEQGWTPIGRMWESKQGATGNRYVLFYQEMESEDVIKFTTQKYDFPRVLVPDASQVHAILAAEPLVDKQGKFQPIQPVSKSLTSSKKNSSTSNRRPSQFAKVQVNNRKIAPLNTSAKWQTPDYLLDAKAYQVQTIANQLPDIEFEVIEEGHILLAASWAYDGNNSGDWHSTRCTREQMISDGWKPITEITRVVGKKEDPHTLFSRVVYAGEKYRFHTRKKTNPILIIPDEKNISNILELLDSPETKIDLKDIAQRKKHFVGLDQQGSKVVMLTTHNNARNIETNRSGHLLRELTRQTVLISARDELGLTTLDQSLGQDFQNAAVSENYPLGVVTAISADNLVAIKLFKHQLNADPMVIWETELSFPSENLYENFSSKLESLSRSEIKQALKDAGFSGSENKWSPAGKVNVEIDQLLNEMTFTSQYLAARQLHQQMRTDGESPERLTALVRAYSNLYMLTNYYWSPLCKTFAARALLYSERLKNREPNTPNSYWVHGYATTLLGRHHTALADYEHAKQIASDGDNSSGKLPGWASVAFAYVKYDQPHLIEMTKDESAGPLARLLVLIRSRDNVNYFPTIDAVDPVLQLTQDCYRAITILHRIRGNTPAGRAIPLYSETIQSNLYRRIQQAKGIPESVLSIVESDIPPEGELATRAKLVSELRKTSVQPNANELDWQVLAEMIEQLTIVQGWHQLSFNLYVHKQEDVEMMKQYYQVVKNSPNRHLIQLGTLVSEDKKSWKPQFLRR